jgi:hypothetical protein
MPKFKDGTVCRIDTTLDPKAAVYCGLCATSDTGPVERLYEHPVSLEDTTPVTIYSVGGAWAVPESCLVAVDPLASWEPIEYRSQPDANGDCDFIQWDGGMGGWMVLDDFPSWVTKEVFPTPEAAAEWVASQG